MPEGGILQITRPNIRIDADGMAPDVRDRAVEPFFTTREVGQGSGLGFSVVYEFARQSRGQVVICSEKGHGSTIRLYLSRALGRTGAREVETSAEVPRGNGESTLVIENDWMSEASSFGWRASSAIALWRCRMRRPREGSWRRRTGSISCCATWCCSGPEFAQDARLKNPDLKVIFMSGYSAEATTRNGFLGPEQVLLNKPFERQQLAEALRGALD